MRAYQTAKTKNASESASSIAAGRKALRARDERGRHPPGAARRRPPWELETLRNNFHGILSTRGGTNPALFGAIDDRWRDLATRELTVVDYKAASKFTEVTL